MTTFDQVAAIVAAKFQKGADTISPDTHLFDDLKADSLDTVEILMDLERAFDIEIDEDRFDGLTTVKELTDLVDELKQRGT